MILTAEDNRHLTLYSPNTRSGANIEDLLRVFQFGVTEIPI